MRLKQGGIRQAVRTAKKVQYAKWLMGMTLPKYD